MGQPRFHTLILPTLARPTAVIEQSSTQFLLRVLSQRAFRFLRILALIVTELTPYGPTSRSVGFTSTV